MIRIVMALLIYLVVACGDGAIGPVEEDNTASPRVNKPSPTLPENGITKHEQPKTPDAQP